MTKKKTKIYFEPMDYFPEEVRKEFKLGEYSETNGDPELIKETKAKKKTTKKISKKETTKK